MFTLFIWPESRSRWRFEPSHHSPKHALALPARAGVAHLQCECACDMFVGGRACMYIWLHPGTMQYRTQFQLHGVDDTDDTTTRDERFDSTEEQRCANCVRRIRCWRNAFNSYVQCANPRWVWASVFSYCRCMRRLATSWDGRWIWNSKIGLNYRKIIFVIFVYIN